MARPTPAPDQPTSGRSAPPLLAMLERWWPRLAFAAAASLVLAAGGTWVYVRYATRPPLAGTVLTPPIRAFDFRLPDQHGQMVALSDFRGKAVALTFLYTHCPDVCPLIADKMGRAYRQLGDVAKRVALVAVSVDPNGDTPEAVEQFLTVHRVAGLLTYLHGSFAQLRPVWAHYYVGSDAKEVNPEAVAASRPTPQQVTHTAIVYVIDPTGEIRAFLPGDFDERAARAPDTQLYRIVGIPTTVLIGADGVVVDTYTGALLGPAASVRS